MAVTQRQLQTDDELVRAANRTFYEALCALDLTRMTTLWLHEEWVKCLHPGWDLLVGWEEVRNSWSEIFRSTSQMMVTISRPLVHVVGDTAWVSCVENITSTYENTFSTAVVEATNIFLRRQGRWLMVHHHTTLMPGQAPAGASSTVQ